MKSIIRPLLVELFTEELPPKSLQKLSAAFATGIHQGLENQALLAPDCHMQSYATPRRLAVYCSAVRAQAPEQNYAEKLMPVKVGLDVDQQPTPALLKRLAAKGLQHIDVAALKRESDGTQEYLIARGVAPGVTLAASLQKTLHTTLQQLPIPKIMSYQLADGVTTVKFVRPAHRLVALFGADVVPVSALGLQADRITQGHRFLRPGALPLRDADAYVETLVEHGAVIPSFEQRQAEIKRQLHAHAQQLDSTLGHDAEVATLLEEVTALVEYPAVYVGEFESRFLQVPQECLILTMRRHQKYFPLFTRDTHALTHRFLIVSNLPLHDPASIVEGNQRVVRPRLADAQFFFDTDRKIPLAARVEHLNRIVYHHQLGSQLARTQRLRAIADRLATTLGVAPQTANRAALLAKADLSTQMVNEFPELQGIVGAYYAQADGEPMEIVQALRHQYQHHLKTAVEASTLTTAILFMADRAETLIGMWSLGLVPTGERDPYGLRRAALGLISAFEQLLSGGWLTTRLAGPLTLEGLLQITRDSFSPHPIEESVLTDVQRFIHERYRHQLVSEFDRYAVEAVLALTPPLHQIVARVRAVTAFSALPEASLLAAANKRIGNLLKKTDNIQTALDPHYLVEPAEQALAQTIAALRPQAQMQFDAGDFGANLLTLAQARGAVDTFFKEVRVMSDDAITRNNRLALLGQLHQLMNQVADISRLAP